MNYKKEKEQVAYFMKRLYTQKLTTCSGGNISIKINDKIILITASQTDKAGLKPEQIGIITLENKNLTPDLKLSMETSMHLLIYKKRPDIKAIIHAHPVVATGLIVSDKKINCKLTGESRAMLGIPVLTPYALMGSKKLAYIVSEASLKTNVILMKNHGVIASGKSLLQAFNRIEILENAAKMTLISELLGNKKELSAKDLKEIDKLFEE
jgi:L-fuculose-phosphate aldolase